MVAETRQSGLRLRWSAEVDAERGGKDALGS